MPKATAKPADNLGLQASETAELKKNFDAIRRVLRAKNIDVEEIIGLVSTTELENASRQVTIRISEEVVSQMNMVAFD